MILSGDEIRQQLGANIIIEPFVADQLNPNSYNLTLHDEIMTKYVLELERADIVGRVRSEIMRELPGGGVTVESVSAGLHNSTRTIRKRLKEENSSFNKLLAEVRKELVKQLMADRNLSLSQISFMLGFSELSAFSRAYKSWFGLPPKVSRSNP
jgi:AraC-like DNA-binding protein